MSYQGDSVEYNNGLLMLSAEKNQKQFNATKRYVIQNINKKDSASIEITMEDNTIFVLYGDSIIYEPQIMELLIYNKENICRYPHPERTILKYISKR